MNGVRLMIAKREHTRVCSQPYKIGAIVHVYTDHTCGLIEGAALHCVRFETRSNDTQSRFLAALRKNFARRVLANHAAITVESIVAKRQAGHGHVSLSAESKSFSAARRGRVYSKREAIVSRSTRSYANRPCTFRGAMRSAHGDVLSNAAARVTGADEPRRAACAGAQSPSFASQNCRAGGVVECLRLIGQTPVSAVPCDRYAGGVVQWDTASRREPSPGAT
ncbi:MAG: hypothetical protein HZB26_02310 [Candidatus Hydrogenedentes bacterium]|nr:hypothetical protein [Candidatus Hydrogenedentota bacterium]